mmetsp:Transcript_12808/g.23742  ORF Transcript_12808/g.23742 Transcript_12808/m.23742 type:complete len:577 (-) Transcript_12808:1493-3223(-)
MNDLKEMITRKKAQAPAADNAAANAADEQDWPQTAGAYELVAQIGQGAFAKVWQARCEAMKSDVAIKIMELDNLTSSLDDIYQEVRVMLLSKNSSVLRAYACFVVKRSLWLVMPLMRKGSCLRIMKVLKRMGLGDGMKEAWIATILKSALIGLEYIHQQGKVHRDIKASNLLMDSDGSVRISDFGVAAWMPTGGLDRRETERRTFVGTPCWMAPEVMEQGEGQPEKADIWSFGITALELAKGYAPYARLHAMKVMLATIKEPPPSLKSYDDYQSTKNKFSRHFKEIITLCLQRVPAQRPSASTLLQKTFFKRAAANSFLVKDLLEAVPISDTCDPHGLFGVSAAERREHERQLEIIRKDQMEEIEKQQLREAAVANPEGSGAPASAPDSVDVAQTPVGEPGQTGDETASLPVESAPAPAPVSTAPSSTPAAETLPVQDSAPIEKQGSVSPVESAAAAPVPSGQPVHVSGETAAPNTTEGQPPAAPAMSVAEATIARIAAVEKGSSFVKGSTWVFDDDPPAAPAPAATESAVPVGEGGNESGAAGANQPDDMSGFEAFAEQYKMMDIKGEDGKTPAE